MKQNLHRCQWQHQSDISFFLTLIMTNIVGQTMEFNFTWKKWDKIVGSHYSPTHSTKHHRSTSCELHLIFMLDWNNYAMYLSSVPTSGLSPWSSTCLVFEVVQGYLWTKFDKGSFQGGYRVICIFICIFDEKS